MPASTRLITLNSIRFPIKAGMIWYINLAADTVEIPDMSLVASAQICWQSPGKVVQTRSLTFDEGTRTTTNIVASYQFVENDIATLALPEVRAYVIYTMTDDSVKESYETIILPFRGEFN